MKSRQCIRRNTMGLIALCITAITAAIYIAFPLLIFTTNQNYPPQISIKSTETTTVVYSIQNQTYKTKSMVIQSIPGIVQSLPCQLAPSGQPGDKCFLVLKIAGNTIPSEGVHTGPVLCEANPNGTPNPHRCYQPSAADNLNINLKKSSVGVMLTVHPFMLMMAKNSSETVTVTNDITSSASASNVTLTVPNGSGLTIHSTCGSSLNIGDSCTITFDSSTKLGLTTSSVKGDNTNTAYVYTTVTAKPVIRITGPAEQKRVVSTDNTTLNLTVTNVQRTGVSARNIRIDDKAPYKAACPGLFVNPLPGCDNVAPGANCILALTSTTPYEPCMITITGDNTANSLIALIAFSHQEGLVFQQNGAHGKVVIGAGNAPSKWTSPTNTDIRGAMSDDDGMSNTNALVSNSACTTSNCAAARCRAISPDWYLPAKNQLQSVIFSLCPRRSSYPCAFGDISSALYWSSTQWFAKTNAYTIEAPSGNSVPTDKSNSNPVRCIRDF